MVALYDNRSLKFDIVNLDSHCVAIEVKRTLVANVYRHKDTPFVHPFAETWKDRCTPEEVESACIDVKSTSPGPTGSQSDSLKVFGTLCAQYWLKDIARA